MWLLKGLLVLVFPLYICSFTLLFHPLPRLALLFQFLPYLSIELNSLSPSLGDPLILLAPYSVPNLCGC